MDRSIGRLLRAVCAGDAHDVEAQLGKPMWSEANTVRRAVEAAVYHAIIPLLAEVLDKQSSHAPLRAAVQEINRAQTAHVLRLESALHDMAGSLKAAGVSFAVYKGPALAHAYYRSPGQRSYVDLDLLVPAASLASVDEAFRDAGCLPAEPYWPDAVRGGYGEVFYRWPNGAAVDVHWHVLREPAVRNRFRLQTSDLVARAVAAQIAGACVPVLDAEDMLIAVAIHACFEGAYRLGWLVDVNHVALSDHLRWDVLADRCAESTVGLPVQIIIDRALRTLGCPQQQLPILADGRWRDAIRLLSAARPVEYTFAQAGRGGLVFRATRRSTSGSLAALTRLGVTEWAKPLATDPNHRWRHRRSKRDRT